MSCHGVNLIKQIPLIPKPLFWTCTCPVSIKLYDKRENLDFDIVNFSLTDGDVTRSTSYGDIFSSHPIC